jgi:hypothetical protein
MHHYDNFSRSHRRGKRIAHFLTALAFFAATTAGLHALSNHYGWRNGPWGAHHAMGQHFHGGWDAPRDVTQQPSPTKQPSLSINPL